MSPFEQQQRSFFSAPAATCWELTHKLASSLAEKNANFVWSPACIVALLDLIRPALQGLEKDKLDALFGNETLMDKADPFGLKTGYAVSPKEFESIVTLAGWIADRAHPSPTFLHEAQRLSATINPFDVVSPALEHEISEWISQQTRGLLKPGLKLSPYTLAVLVSTLYLKAHWDGFDFCEEWLETLHFVNHRHALECKSLCAVHDFPFVETDENLMVTLPLEGGASMALLLSKKAQRAPMRQSAQAQDVIETIKAMLPSVQTSYLELKIPKFSVETPQTDLTPILAQTDILNLNTADLSPLTDHYPLKTMFAHAAKLNFDERGIEAGAYAILTIIDGAPLAFDLRTPRTICFDHPFDFVLLSPTQVPLFVGHVEEPEIQTGSEA